MRTQVMIVATLILTAALAAPASAQPETGWVPCTSVAHIYDDADYRRVPEGRPAGRLRDAVHPDPGDAGVPGAAATLTPWPHPAGPSAGT